MATHAEQRTVLLAGATGPVGGLMLQALLADHTISAVHALSRRSLNVRHPKLDVRIVDFSHVPELPQVDEVCLALGTTIKVAGSQEAFRAVDLEANLAVARAAVQAGHDALAWSVRPQPTRDPPCSTSVSRASWRTRLRRWISRRW